MLCLSAFILVLSACSSSTFLNGELVRSSDFCAFLFRPLWPEVDTLGNGEMSWIEKGLGDVLGCGLKHSLETKYNIAHAKTYELKPQQINNKHRQDRQTTDRQTDVDTVS